jgi:hypothetical protein
VGCAAKRIWQKLNIVAAVNVKRRSLGKRSSQAPQIAVIVIALQLAVATQCVWAEAKSPPHDALPKGLLVFAGAVKGRDPAFENSRAIVSVTTPTLARKILRKPGAGFVTMSSVSADGKKVAFFWNSAETYFIGTPADVRVLDTVKGTETTLLYGEPADTLWSPDGSILCMDSPFRGDDKILLDLERNRMWKWRPRLPVGSSSSRGVIVSLRDAMFTARGIVAPQHLDGTPQAAYVQFYWSDPAEVIAPTIEGLQLRAQSPDLSRIADVDRKGTLTIRSGDGDNIKWFNLRMDLLGYPAWSPDGGWVALMAVSKKAAKFVAANANTGNTVDLGGMIPIWPGAQWVSLEPLPHASVLASVEAALGPGEAIKFPIDCQREAKPTEDWSKYQPIGTCPLSLQPTVRKNHE